MEDDKDIRKKRRRSVRNLRRQSGVLPLNLNVLDEGIEVGTAEVSQSDGNQQEMYGSMWWESQEPAVKKRRRRSCLFDGLASITMKPAVEAADEQFDDRNNHNVNITKISEEQSDMHSVVERTENEDSNTSERSELQIQTNVNGVVSLVQVKELQNTCNLPGLFQCSEKISLVKTGEEMKGIEERVGSVENFAELSKVNNYVDENITLNTSDISSKSPGNLNVSKISPTSMSPDFPMSPNTAIYQDPQEESYYGINNTSNVMTDGKDCNRIKLELTQTADVLAHSECEIIQKSLGDDNVSDLSHSDKENSTINDNFTLNTTPQVNDESAEKVSPGFMSFCKAFTGKVVNFVRTSPSFLTGSVTDSVFDSPPLKGNTSLNLESNKLSNLGVQSDIDESRNKLDAEINKESIHSERGENRGACNAGTSKSTEIESKSTNKSKSTDSVKFGSAKKQRDRKSFFDTFNAVSDELKNDRRKSSCTDDVIETVIDKTVCTDFSHHMKQNTQQSREGISGDFTNFNSDIYRDEAVLTDSALSDKVTNENNASNNQPRNSISNNDTVFVGDVAKNKNVTNALPEVAALESTCTVGLSNKTCHTELKENTLFDEKCTDMLFRNVTHNLDMEVDCITTTSIDVCNSICVADNTEHQGEKIVIEEAVIENTDTEHCDDRLRIPETVCESDIIHEKYKTKRRKRRTLHIQTDVCSETYIASATEKDLKVAAYENLNEKKQKLSTELSKKEKQIEITDKGPKEWKSMHQAKSPVQKDSSCVADGKITISDKQKTECDRLEKGDDTKKATKIRKNRRKSFGFQSNFLTDKVVSNRKKRNTGIDIIANETKLAKAVVEGDGSNEFNEEELHLEKRVAELDLGIESAETKCENDTGSSEIDKQDFQGLQPSKNIKVQNKFSRDSNVEKKIKGRGRKSANLNDTLKKGRPPRTGIIEHIPEKDEHSNTDGNENQNMSDLTNEISKVQISGTNTDQTALESEISVESLILPNVHVTIQDQKNEPKRKRRRSAETASLKLQAEFNDASPPSGNLSRTSEDKPRRRKSAHAAALKIQLGFEGTECIEESSPNEGAAGVTKHGKKRKRIEESFDELEKIYRNKNFVKPEEKKPWQTVLESPTNPVEVFGKKRLQRHIEFERPTQMKLRRRLQRAVKNGWDPKKRKRSELKDDFVQNKLADLWSELDQAEEGPDSLQNRLRSIVETI